MPELPEVETTCRGIRPYLCGVRIVGVTLRESRLRWPVDAEIASLQGQMIHSVERRAKYLLFKADKGCAIVHLGMSGSLRIVGPKVPLRKHDHVLIDMDSGLQLRFHDPRRFGAWLWSAIDPLQHPLLQKLGIEPFDKDFNGAYLQQHCKGRKKSIKAILMDASVVVGVGNIYANEALFYAGIRPTRAARRLSLPRLMHLAEAIKIILQRSIEQGGTTLRDFLREDGRPGYFSQQLAVYGRKGQACGKCGQAIRHGIIGQRSTYYCAHCQR